jgi:hypothetical protein
MGGWLDGWIDGGTDRWIECLLHCLLYSAYTGLLKMIVGVLTTFHTQYT